MTEQQGSHSITLSATDAVMVAEALDYTRSRMVSILARRDLPADYAARCDARRIACEAALVQLPAPPVRVKRPTRRDKLRALLADRPMAVDQITRALGCSDKQARAMLKTIGARVASVGPYNKKTWTL